MSRIEWLEGHLKFVSAFARGAGEGVRKAESKRQAGRKERQRQSRDGGRQVGWGGRKGGGKQGQGKQAACSPSFAPVVLSPSPLPYSLPPCPPSPSAALPTDQDSGWVPELVLPHTAGSSYAGSPDLQRTDSSFPAWLPFHLTHPPPWVGAGSKEESACCIAGLPEELRFAVAGVTLELPDACYSWIALLQLEAGRSGFVGHPAGWRHSSMGFPSVLPGFLPTRETKSRA